MMNAKAEQRCWVVVVEGEVDQFCGSRREAEREARDLRDMGCGRVKVREFATWSDADAWADKVRGY